MVNRDIIHIIIIIIKTKKENGFFKGEPHRLSEMLVFLFVEVNKKKQTLLWMLWIETFNLKV